MINQKLKAKGFFGLWVSTSSFNRLCLPYFNEVTSKKCHVLSLMLGGPVSGRALLAETLKSKMNYYHLSIGDLLQYELTHGSQRGEMLKEFMASGDSAPNHIVDEILMEAMVQNANKFEVRKLCLL